MAGGPARDSGGHAIGLSETLPPLASSQQTVCALDARLAADGSVSGRRSLQGASGGISQGAFPVPGAWTCVARAFAGVTKPPPGDSDPMRATAWSAPVRAFFQTGVSLVSLVSLKIADSRAPGFALAGKLNPAAAGGLLTMSLQATPRCPRAVTKELVRAHVRADGSFRLRMRLAVGASHRGKLDIALWRGAVSFAGNRLVRSNPRFGELFLGRSVAFVAGIGYLRSPAKRRLKLFTGGTCTHYA